MNRIRTLLAVAAALAAGTAFAQGTATPPPNPKSAVTMDSKTTVQGVRLSRICEGCAVVNGTRMEKRKGEAKGVGAVGGAVVGGVVGNKVGDSTTSTVVGAGVGGVLGHQLEKRMKRQKVWITTVTMKDGSQKDFEAKADPQWAAGSVVEVGADGALKAYVAPVKTK
jgi:outer membrane lipoprotein SlyB